MVIVARTGGRITKLGLSSVMYANIKMHACLFITQTPVYRKSAAPAKVNHPYKGVGGRPALPQPGEGGFYLNISTKTRTGDQRAWIDEAGDREVKVIWAMMKKGTFFYLSTLTLCHTPSFWAPYNPSTWLKLMDMDMKWLLVRVVLKNAIFEFWIQPTIFGGRPTYNFYFLSFSFFWVLGVVTHHPILQCKIIQWAISQKTIFGHNFWLECPT